MQIDRSSMSARRNSVNSIDDFFGESKDSPKDLPTQSSAVAALIRSQPVLHHRQTPSDRDAPLLSQRTPVNGTSSKPTPLDSFRSKTYDSGFENDKSRPFETPAETPVRPLRSIISKPAQPKKNNIDEIPIVKKNQRYVPYTRASKRPKPALNRLRVKPTRNQVKDRLRSAQQSKYNELQSYLNELERQLDKERTENRTLRLIQQREEKTLKMYEDQEYDAHRVARDFNREIKEIEKDLDKEREITSKYQRDVSARDQQLREQVKRIKRYEHLINEPELDETQDLNERLKKLREKLSDVEEKMKRKEKSIKNLEEKNEDELHDELMKTRDLKRRLQRQNQSYQDLLSKVENKNRQVGTMHIYIQRGGRRPSNSSVRLSKSRSLQSLVDTSPRFREKVLEYDKKRREQEKLKPRPKPRPLPAIPPRIERKKNAPKIITTIITPTEPAHLFLKEKLPQIATEQRVDDEKSLLDDDTTYQSTLAKSPSSSIDRNDSKSREFRSSPPILPHIEPRLVLSGRENRRNVSHLPKLFEPLPSSNGTGQSQRKTNFDEKSIDFFDFDSKETKSDNDLLSNLISHAPTQKKIDENSNPSGPAMIMFEPTTIQQETRIPKRVVNRNNYEFGEPVKSLHNGKPVRDKSKLDLFDSPPLAESSSRFATVNPNRDDTFTISETKIEPLDGLFGPTKTSSTLQRPKIVNNISKTVPNRTLVDDIEEILV